MVGRLLSALWTIVLVLLLLKGLVVLVRDGQIAFALAALIIPVGIKMVLWARESNRRTAGLAGIKDEQGSAVLRQLSEPDQVCIASLAASGNAIGAIQSLRTLVHVDLRTAKAAVDQLAVPTDR